MCPDRTQYRLGSPDAPDGTRYSAWVQDAQDAQDAESRLGESGCNTTVSDAVHLFADVSERYPRLHTQPAAGRTTITSETLLEPQIRFLKVHAETTKWEEARSRIVHAQAA